MAEKRTFACINDQTGEQKDCTLDDFMDMTAQGFRVVDVAGYVAAMGDANAPAEPTPGQEAMAEQAQADAEQASKEQYPEANKDGGAAADEAEKKLAAERVEAERNAVPALEDRKEAVSRAANKQRR